MTEVRMHRARFVRGRKSPAKALLPHPSDELISLHPLSLHIRMEYEYLKTLKLSREDLLF